MAMDRSSRPMHRGRRKVCSFCVDRIDEIDYKDVARLRKYVSERAKIIPRRVTGTLADAMAGADLFVGVSAPGIVTQDMVRSMAPKAMVFAMANPVPEILPQEALDAGAAVVGTGRSDYPNQINNVLAFPGIFRGALDVRASDINEEMKMAAARALAELVSGAAMAAPLVMVGMGMMSGITQITWKHVEISLPSFLMIVGMPFTFSITTGVMLGVVSYVVVMVCRKRAHLIDPALYLLAVVFVLDAVLGALP